MFLIAAETIAKHCTDEDIQKGSLYPPLSLIRECSFDIAIGIAKYAYAKGEFVESSHC
jgi:malate dehydrogenase (oxaloacetate-decarboxylating)(NADP+)